ANWLIEGTRGSDIYRWQLNTGGTPVVTTLSGHKLGVTSVAFDRMPTPAPQKSIRFATASADGSIMLWDLATGKPFAKAPLVGHASQINGLAFSPNGSKLASAGQDGAIRVWNVPLYSGTFLVDADPLGTRVPNPVDGGKGMVALAFSGDGNRIAGVYR